MLVVRKPAAVDHCRSFLVFLTGSLSALDLAIIDSLAPESTRALISRVLECLYFLTSGMYVAPRGGGIVPVNGHVNLMDVNAKGSDQITTNNHIMTVDVDVDYV